MTHDSIFIRDTGLQLFFSCDVFVCFGAFFCFFFFLACLFDLSPCYLVYYLVSALARLFSDFYFCHSVQDLRSVLGHVHGQLGMTVFLLGFSLTVSSLLVNLAASGAITLVVSLH